MEYEADRVQKDILLDQVCGSYIKCIQAIRDTDMDEICGHIYQAKRLFVFGTGESRYAAAAAKKLDGFTSPRPYPAYHIIVPEK